VSQSGWTEYYANVFGSWVSETWFKREETHYNCEHVQCWSPISLTRSLNTSRLEWNHMRSGGTSVGSCWMDSYWGRWVGRGGISSSLSSFKE
jgi:hypothetical protein